MGRLDNLWEAIQKFLNMNDKPNIQTFEYGNIRYSMGMHRYYFEREVLNMPEVVSRLQELATRHNLALDARETPTDQNFNYVIYKDGVYIGRAEPFRLILMPQRMERDIFRSLLSIYGAED